MKIIAYDTEETPLGLMADMLYTHLMTHPRRIAFGGPAGAGKTEMCRLIAGTSEFLSGDDFLGHPPVPIINHADKIKEEVLEWVSRSKTRGLIPGDPSVFTAFCDFWGISQRIVERDLYEILYPVYLVFNQLLEDAYDHMPALRTWSEIPSGHDVEAKVAFVDAYKKYFRSSLQQYGEAVKIIGSDPLYWVEQTVTRGLEHRFCLNGDTRYKEEMELLEHTGWTTIYIAISRDTQKIRRPDLTEQHLAHKSEHGLRPEDCRYVVDGNHEPTRVLRDIYNILAGSRVAVPV